MELFMMTLPYLITMLAIILVSVAAKYLKWNIDQKVIENLLYAIINQITNVELRYRGETGLEKQKRVLREIEQGKILKEKDKSTLKKVFGTLDVAVERAFQMSHLAKKFIK
jgi:hypothetical protein